MGHPGGATRSGTIGPVDYPGSDNGGGSIDVTVSVSDGDLRNSVSGSVSVAPCEAPPAGD